MERERDSVNWYTDKMLKENYEASVSMYRFIERDLDECIEYVAFSEDHLQVYSFRFANLILRIGPEILRLFNLILFNPNTTAHLSFHREVKPSLIKLQKRCEDRTDNIMDYFGAMRKIRMGGLGSIAVKVKALDKYILPFEVEKRQRVRDNGEQDLCEVIPWWEDGYNALRHRVIKEFKESATFQNALFSLAGVWVLHSEYLGHDWGYSSESGIFEKCTDKYKIEADHLPVLKYTQPSQAK